MKNKLKSVRRGSKTAAAPQSKTAQSQARIQPAGTVTCVWTGPDGRESFRTEFERELFSLIQRVAAKMGITLQRFFDNAIREFCDSQDSRRAA